MGILRDALEVMAIVVAYAMCLGLTVLGILFALALFAAVVGGL